MASQLVPSSSFTITPSWEYDVFLSFRGKDTRTNFTNHLYHALVRRGIRTFLDDSELPTGEEISPTLLKAIENSRISIIVFSENYASSRWCLDELVHILECRKSKGQMTRPIFYKVDPSDVRHQKNSYGVAFAVPSRKYENEPEKVQRWRIALTEAGNLKGDTINEREYETTFIDRIVEEISTQVLSRTYLHVAKYRVGMQSCVEEVEELLGVGENDRRVVGIWGTSGIGKTEIAKAVHNAIAHKFEGSCFLSDVRETSASREGVVKLQNRLLSKILCGTKFQIDDYHEGTSHIKKLLRQKKILLILDDVDRPEQLNNLIEVDIRGLLESYGEGSRVIITTKDRGLLEFYGVKLIYEVQKLEKGKALELLSLNAFGRNKPPKDYLRLARRAIAYAQGLPLALNIIGSHLRNKCIDRWQAILDGYDSYDGEPYTDIQKILRKTYDAWDYGLQQVFLDIACFFKGEYKDYVLQILRSSTLNVRQDCIEVLVEKAIITIEDNWILMHDLLQKMGEHIVYDESPTEPGKRSRLWFHEDVYNVLTENQGTKKIRSIVVELPESNVIPLNPESFLRMVNLEIFINRNAHFSGRVDYLPNSLRWFDLRGQSIKHTVVLNLPSNFHPRHLVKFDVSYSGIRQLKGFKNLAMLTWMYLSGCEFLEKIPDLSGSPNLEHLFLSGCKNLVEVDDSVGFLDKLMTLDLSGCSNLTRFATRLGLRSLEELDLRGCTRLERFPEIEKDKMKSLTLLKIGTSGIRVLPSSIAYLTGLTQLIASGCCELQNVPDLSGSPNIMALDFSDCTSLVEIDDSVGFLDKLEILNLSGCSKLPRSLFYLSLGGCRRLETNLLRSLHLERCNLSESDFLVPLDCWSALTILYLSRNNFVSLPDCISNVVNLERLHLSGCKRLREIPVLPPKLKELHLDGCASLEKIPKLLPSLELLNIKGCNLSESDFLVHLDRISKFVNLMTLNLRDCKRLREIPVLPPKLHLLHLDGCTSLEKIPKLPPSLSVLTLCNCSGLSGDEVAKLEKNLLNKIDLCNCSELSSDEVAKLVNYLLNKEIYSRWSFIYLQSTIYPGNEVPKWFSYTSNHPTTIQPLPEYHRDEYDRKVRYAGGSEFRFEIPLKLQVGETLFGLALSFVLEPSTCYSHHEPRTHYPNVKCILINGKKTFEHYLYYYYEDLKATHVRVVIVELGEQEQQGDTCKVVYRLHNGCPIKSCGVHCLTSSLGKRPQSRGSLDIVVDEYDQQQIWQISPNVPFDIEWKVVMVDLGEQEQGDTCQVVFSLHNGCPVKSCGVHGLTSSLGKRPHPHGSLDIVDDEYDQQQQWLSSSSEPTDDHPKRRQIDPNVPMDIEEDEEQEQPSASDVVDDEYDQQQLWQIDPNVPFDIEKDEEQDDIEEDDEQEQPSASSCTTFMHHC